MSGTDTAAMIPGQYDCVLDGYGYNFLRTIDTSLPFRTQRAMYTQSPTFVERSNVSNAYGDNAQDFFLTIRQRDWSLGEQQKYFRPGTDGRYWQGTNIDVSTPGQVRLAPSTPSLSFANSVITGTRDTSQSSVLVASAARLYRLDVAGGITDLGAHGLGAAPTKFSVACDGGLMYMSTSTAGTVGVRSWNNAAFATFSATASDALAFVNNTLYGWNKASTQLFRYDTAGTATAIFQWLNAIGGAGTNTNIYTPMMCAYGGKILLCFPFAQESSELWVYDGSGTYRLEVFPPNFVATDIEVVYGVVYIAGNFYKAASTTTWYTRPTVMFYDGSQIGMLWQANDYSTSTVAGPTTEPGPALGVSGGRLLFTDDTMATVMAYDPALGGVSTSGSYSAGGSSAVMITSNSVSANIRNQTTAYYFPHTTSYSTSGTVISSLVDFDSSLPKQFRGVKLEWDAASDGNGGSVDIAYQVDSVTGSWTSLQTGAVSGTEYTFSNISGHAIAIKATLNKGTSTAGPTLKALNLRAVPTLQSYKLREYILDLSGRNGSQPVIANDDSTHPLEGLAMATNLNATIAATAPFTVIDRFGSFTAVCEPDQCELIEIGPEEYIARVRVRGV